MWKKIADYIVRYRVVLLVFIGIVTISMLYIASKVTFSSNMYPFSSSTDSAIIGNNEYPEIFSQNPTSLLIGIDDSTFFDREKFNHFLSLKDSITSIEGVIDYNSIAQTYYLKKNTTQKKFDKLKVFDENIHSQRELDNLKDTVKTFQIYKGILYNDSSYSYVIIITLHDTIIKSGKSDIVFTKIKKHIAHYTEKYHSTTHFSGIPFIQTQINAKVKHELFLFSIIALILSSLIVYFFFRSIKVIIIAFVTVVISIIWALGLMGLLGFTINIYSIITPILFIVIGIPTVVFFIQKFQNECQKHGNKILALQRTIIRTTTNTILSIGIMIIIIGGVSLFMSHNSMVQEFGLILSCGFVGNLFLTLVFVPIIVSYIPISTIEHPIFIKSSFYNRVTSQVKFLAQQKILIYGSLIILISVSVFGIIQLQSNRFFVDDFPQDEKLISDFYYFEENFGGIFPFQIVIDTKKTKGAYKLSTLKKIEYLYEHLTKYPEISQTLSILDYLKFSRQSFYQGNPQYYSLPDQLDAPAIISYMQNQSSGIDKTIIDSKESKIIIKSVVKDIGTNSIKELQNKIYLDAQEIFRDTDFTISITGLGVSFSVFHDKTKIIFIQIVLLLLLSIIILVFMYFKNLKMLLFVLIATVVPLLIMVGFMGLAAIPIQNSTIIVLSLAIALGVDNAIQFLIKYKYELRLTHNKVVESVEKTIKEIGKNILIKFFVVFLGFVILVASKFNETIVFTLLFLLYSTVAVFCNLLIISLLVSVFNKNDTSNETKITSGSERVLYSLMNENEEEKED